MSRATAARKVARPSMRTRFSSCEAVTARDPAPSARSRIGPIRAAPPGTTTAAPAPSPNRPAVRGSSRSSTRLISSAPITRVTLGAPGLGRRGGQLERREEAGAGGADVDRARARGADAARRPAARRSGPARRGSRSRPGSGRRRRDRPRRARARAPPASAASSASVVARGRVAALEDPGARAIQSPSTPSRAAISSLATTRSGSARGDRRRSRPPGARRAARRLAVGSLDDARHGRPPVGELDLDLVEDPGDELRQHPAGPDVAEAAGADRAAGGASPRPSGPGW